MHDKPSLYDKLIAAIPGMARLQEWVITLCNRPSALKWLLGLTFLESIFFPVPTDPLLAGVVLAKPERYIRIAILTTIASVLGGIVGWLIGVYLGKAIITMGWIGDSAVYAEVTAAFETHGWFLILMGAFTPLPYKITVIVAGFFGIGFVPLVLASLVGRFIRYGLIASIVRFRQDTKLATLLVLILIGLFTFFWWYTH